MLSPQMLRSKMTRRLAAAGALGLLLVVVPVPRLQFTNQMVGATVALPPADPASAEEMVEVQAAADEPLDTQRVQATEEATAEFSLMAVVFETPPAEPVMVRVQDDVGAWGEWQELHVADDEGPDDPTNFGTEPFWVGSSEAYEVNLDTGDAADARVVLVRSELRRAVTVSEPVAGASNSPPFPVNTRAAWGARAVGAMSYGSTIRKAVVHHTVSGNSYSPAQVPGILRGIQAYHIDGRGWSDIGYNFLVDKYGGLWEGRAGGIDRPVIGAHASGFNTNTVGISVLGDYTSGGPSGASVESVSQVAGWKLYLGNTDPAGGGVFTSGGGPRYAAGTVVNLPNVVGHGDVGSTTCPGRIRDSLGVIRQRAQAWTNRFRALLGPPGNGGGSPFGYFDGIYQNGDYVNVWGWAIDPDQWRAPLSVHIVLNDRQSWAVLAQESRADVARAYPGYRSQTGFGFGLRLPKGTHKLCAVAINQGFGGNSTLGCQTVVVK